MPVTGTRRWAHWAVLFFCLALVSPDAVRAADATAIVQRHLYAGTAKSADAELGAALAEKPADGDLTFGLGVVRFVRAAEHLSRSLYRYGLRPPVVGRPVMRMPVPRNPEPDQLGYEGFRHILQDLVDDLKAADTTLGAVGEPPVRLTLDPSRIRLDIVGDGAKRDDERLWVVINGMAPATAKDADLTVVLDRADAAWLRGYANLVMGFTEWVLAHDFHELFDETSGLFFPRTTSSETLQGNGDPGRADILGVPGSDTTIADAITFIHLLHWPVAEPARMAAARDHLLRTIAMSRANWSAILARTDDDRHWIPGPGRKGIIDLPVTRERIDAWLRVLDEGEAALEGRKLVPHWRYKRGIDLARVFGEPRPFDLVMWLTGPGARPYLADGETISSQSWQQLLRAFEGNFLTYAFWFN